MKVYRVRVMYTEECSVGRDFYVAANSEDDAARFAASEVNVVDEGEEIWCSPEGRHRIEIDEGCEIEEMPRDDLEEFALKQLTEVEAKDYPAAIEEAAQAETRPAISPADAMEVARLVHAALDGKSWNAAALDAIAEILTQHGMSLRDYACDEAAA